MYLLNPSLLLCGLIIVVILLHMKVSHVCGCFTDQYNEVSEGPFYTHLGAASSMVAIRHIMEER